MKIDSILSKTVFQEGMLRLEAGFMIKSLTKETLQVYYERLSYCNDGAFLKAIDAVLDNEDWFPVIKKLLKYLPVKKQYISWG